MNEKPHKVQYSAIGFTEDGNYVNVPLWGDWMDIRSEGHKSVKAAQEAAEGLFGQDKRVAWVGISEYHQYHPGQGWHAGPSVARVTKDGKLHTRAESQVIRWLRQQPDLWREAAEIAENPDNEFEYGDHELADAIELWLFSQRVDNYLVNNLGMSPDLRNRLMQVIDRDEFYEISWENVREALIEEDAPNA